MVNHSIFSRGIKYDYMNILTWTILKKTQILNGCETFAFKYIYIMNNKLRTILEKNETPKITNIFTKLTKPSKLH